MWAERLEAFRASGQSAVGWSAQHDINPNQLRCWLRKSRDQENEASSPQWLEVDIAPGGDTPEGGLRVRVVGPAAIQVGPGYDPGLLQFEIMPHLPGPAQCEELLRWSKKLPPERIADCNNPDP